MDAFAGPKFYAKIYLDTHVITIFVPWGGPCDCCFFLQLKSIAICGNVDSHNAFIVR